MVVKKMCQSSAVTINKLPGGDLAECFLFQRKSWLSRHPLKLQNHDPVQKANKSVAIFFEHLGNALDRAYL